jgi:hypothetical protein
MNEAETRAEHVDPALAPDTRARLLQGLAEKGFGSATSRASNNIFTKKPPNDPTAPTIQASKKFPKFRARRPDFLPAVGGAWQ